MSGRWTYPLEAVAVLLLGLAVITLTGAVYGIPLGWGVLEAAGLGVAGAALLTVGPGGHVMGLLRSRDPGGALFRRVGPVLLALPLVLGWVQVHTVGAGVLTDRSAAWWISAVTASVLVAIIWLCARSLSRTDAVRRALEDALVEQATLDPLTGLANRRSFDAALGAQLARAQRHEERAVLLLLDLDRFKAVNDELGHAAGDALLVAVARTLDDRTRRADLPARLGGDEFAVILPHTDLAGAMCVATDLVAAIGALDADGARSTVSVGLAVVDGGGEALAAADAAMYRAKRAGGDRCAFAGPATALAVPSA